MVWNPYDTPEIAEHRKAQVEEYTTYVATDSLYVGTALAHHRGDPVPKSTVETEGNPWLEDGKVVKRRSSEGLAILDELGLATEDDRPAAAAKTVRAKNTEGNA